MIKGLQRLISSLLTMACVAVCSAGDITILPVPTLDQLPTERVEIAFQDSYGYMWYGTPNGVSRDDGYAIQYFPLPGQCTVNAIAETTGGDLLLATTNGSYCIDRDTYCITRFPDPHVATANVRALLVDNDGQIWMGIYGYLHRFSPDGKWLKAYPVHDRRNKPTFTSGLCQGWDGSILMTTYSPGVYVYNLDTDEFIMPSDFDRDYSFGPIFSDPKHHCYWIATYQSAIVRFQPSDPEGKNYYVTPVNSPYLGPNQHRHIHKMQIDPVEGNIWIATKNCLHCFSVAEDCSLQPIENNLTRDLRGYMMWTMVPIEGGLWIAGHDHPSVRAYFEEPQATHLALSGILDETDCLPFISHCMVCQGSKMWLVQERTGLMLYDLETDKVISPYSPHNISHRLNQIITTVPSLSYPGIWALRSHDRVILLLEDGRNEINVVKSINLYDYLSTTTSITALTESRDGHLWIGTNDGVYKYNIRTDEIERHSAEGEWIVDLLEDSNDNIWAIPTERGILKFTSNGSMERFHDDRDFTRICIDTSDMIWLASARSGLLRFDLASGELCDYTADCNIKGYQVSQILCDSYDCPWIITDRGAMRFQPDTRTYSIYEANEADSDIRRYLTGCIDPSDPTHIIFAGIGGMSVLPVNPPSEFVETPIPVFISDITYSGVSVIFDDAVVDANFTLPAMARNVEISMSSLNHRHADNVRYAYKLDGVDKDWIYTDRGANKAFYNYIPKGGHRLHIIASDEFGRWSNDETIFLINKEPAWYESWWATLIYIIIALAIAYMLIRVNNKRVRKQSDKAWSESRALMEMHDYLTNEGQDKPEFLQLDKALIEKATRLIREHMSDPAFDVNVLASKMNMSRSTLFRKIKDIAGTTPANMIRDMRMKHACALLCDKDRTISEVAELVGYEDRRQFTSVFKREIGMPPIAYQKEHSQPAAPMVEEATSVASDSDS